MSVSMSVWTMYIVVSCGARIAADWCTPGITGPEWLCWGAEEPFPAAVPPEAVCGLVEPRRSRRSIIYNVIMVQNYHYNKYCNHYNNCILTFSWLKWVKILISRSVRWQNVWCSNGAIFLIATRCFVTLSVAALEIYQIIYKYHKILKSGC